MSEAADRRPVGGQVEPLPVARPVGVVLPRARAARVGRVGSLLLDLSAGAAAADVVLLAAVFLGLQFAQEMVRYAFLGDAPVEVYRRWTPGVVVGTGMVLAVFVLAVARGRGQSLSALGLTVWRCPAEVGIGVLGAAVILLATVVVGIYVQVFFPYLVPLLQESQESIGQALPPMGLGTIVLLTVVVAFYEELLFRGFVLPRLRVLTGSWWSAVLLGAAGFGLLHVYEGGLAVIFIMGLAGFFSVLFLWRRSLVAPMVAHLLFNALQLVMLERMRGMG